MAVIVFLDNPPSGVESWNPIFYINSQAYYPDEIVVPEAGSMLSVPTGQALFRCFLRFTSGDTDYKDINTPFNLVDEATYSFDWASGTLSYAAPEVIAEGYSNEDLDSYLNGLGALPLNSKFSITLDFNLAILMAKGYQNATAYVSQELVPLFNQVGAQIYLPLTSNSPSSVTMHGIVAEDFTRQTYPTMEAGSGIGKWVMIGIISGILFLTGSILLTHFVVTGIREYYAGQAVVIAAQKDYFNNLVAKGVDPTLAAKLTKEMNDKLSLNIGDWMKYLPWVLIGVGGIIILSKILPKFNRLPHVNL
jgi:serine/threonine protein kinase